MLQTLLDDLQKLTADVPPLQAAVIALQNDLANPAALNLPQLETDAENAAVLLAQVQSDVTAVTLDLGTLPQTAKPVAGKLGAIDMHRDAEGIFRALPIMGRLRLASSDLTQINADRAKFGGRINWCALAASAAAIIAQLTAAGVPIPPYLTIVLSIVTAFCPTPPAPTPTPTNP